LLLLPDNVNVLSGAPGLRPTKQTVFVATLLMVGIAIEVIGLGNTVTVINLGNETHCLAS
jgi:hypothetical protein